MAGFTYRLWFEVCNSVERAMDSFTLHSVDVLVLRDQLNLVLIVQHSCSRPSFSFLILMREERVGMTISILLLARSCRLCTIS